MNIESILRRSSYKTDFTSLAKAFIEVYEETKCGRLNIFERENESFVSIKTRTENKKVKEMAALLNCEQTFNKEEPLLLFNFPLFDHGHDHHVVFPFQRKGECSFIVIVSFQTKQEALQAIQTYETEWVDIFSLLQSGYEQETYVKQSERRDILLQGMKTFYLTLNSEEVLAELSNIIKRTFPDFRICLWLTRELETRQDLHIRPFTFGRGLNERAEKAYLSGDVQIETSEKSIAVYIPLQGKQGVYGVLEISTTERHYLPAYEIEFLKMLSFSGGVAIENAELYKQTNNLVRDLQLINETTHQLNSSLRLQDMVDYMREKMMTSFEAEEVGFIMFFNDEPDVLEGSTSFFHEYPWFNKLRRYIEELIETKEPLYLGNLKDHELELGRYRSALIIPMIENNEVNGIVFVLHSKPYHFTFDEFKLLQSLIHHSTLAFTNSLLHEELERLVNTDYLTKLFTRSYLDNLVERSLIEDDYGTFILLDIDDFKSINDRYGHHVGDEILVSVASIVVDCVRDRGIVARWGGEEIAIYLPKVDIVLGKKIAESIVCEVRQRTSPRVTVSIGIADWQRTDEAKTLQELFRHADEALYAAKESGKNRVVTR